MRGLGTLLNVGTVALGTTVGVLFGTRVPERFRITVMQGLGLIVVALADRRGTARRRAAG